MTGFPIVVFLREHPEPERRVRVEGFSDALGGSAAAGRRFSPAAIHARCHSCCGPRFFAVGTMEDGVAAEFDLRVPPTGVRWG